MSNYTAGHESRATLLGDARLAYPANHIEADNRLSWLLGRLDEKFGPDAFYVHLTRDEHLTASSYDKRWHSRFGIMPAYREAILSGTEADSLAICADYVATANANIRSFLKDKPLKMDFRLEESHQLWPVFWERVGAEGDFEGSLAEWTLKHNAAPGPRSVFRRGLDRANALLSVHG
jgi:hypothetical protein